MTEVNNSTARSRSGLFRASDDTIAAIATPAGTGGVAVIRISGPDAAEILGKVAPAHRDVPAGMMVYGDFLNGTEKVDDGYSVFFAGPRSYTGEDTVELQCHGGSVISALVLQAAVAAGARPAEPGEFTKRAFLNGKLDLSQAEAVGDLIGAISEAGVRIAQKQIHGQLKEELMQIQNRLTDLIAEIESVLEYPDEDMEETETIDVTGEIERLRNELTQTAESWYAGHLLRDGLSVTLAGAPNAGKSSLYNSLCGDDRAIVAQVPGTTRDILENTVAINQGTVLRLTDTAGLRESDDPLETEGIRRAREAARQSDLILYLVDASVQPGESDRREVERLLAEGRSVAGILSKTDLPMVMDAQAFSELYHLPMLPLSTVTGAGMTELRALLYEKAGGAILSEERVIIADMRQKHHLESAAKLLNSALDILKNGGPQDLICTDLRAAWVELGEITGTTAGEEIIDRIFSKFCLGK